MYLHLLLTFYQLFHSKLNCFNQSKFFQMSAKGPFVSSLNLRFLDAKFIAICDHSSILNDSLSQIRKQKVLELPNILKGSDCIGDQSTCLENELNMTANKSKIKSLMSEESSLLGSLKGSKSPRYSEIEGKELEKYRKMIQKIKTQNQLIHQEISHLYKAKKIEQRDSRVKKVKLIHQATQDHPNSLKRLKLNQLAQSYELVYQNLSSSSNPYQSETMSMQNKFANNNLHKNFESFLQGKNKRVPEFIKNIR